MKNGWWINLAIAGILGLLSVHGFIIAFGAFGVLALNIVWLTVYTPRIILKLLKVQLNQLFIYLS